MNEKKPEYLRNVSAVAMAFSISSYIIGPLILFGALGWFLADKYHNKLLLFAAIVVAFICSNLLIWRNIKDIIEDMKKRSQ